MNIKIDDMKVLRLFFVLVMTFPFATMRAQERTSVDVYVEDLENYQSYFYDVDEVRLHGATNCVEHEWTQCNYVPIASSPILIIDRDSGCEGALMYHGQGYVGGDTITCNRERFEIYLGNNFIHLSVDTLSNYYYFCNSYDGVVIHAPEGCDDFAFSFYDRFWSDQSPIIVSHSTQGKWSYSDDCSGYHIWWIYFRNNPPTEPWWQDEMEMCSSTTRLYGQDINMPDYTYLWTTGETAPYIDVTEPGIYGVTVTDVCGNTVSDQVTIVHNNPFHEPYLPDTTFFCEGDSVILDPGESFVHYAWYSKDEYGYYLAISNDSALTVTEPGVYMVFTENEYDCFHRIETRVMYMPAQSIDLSNPLVTNDTVTMSGNNMLCWTDENPYIAEVKVYREGMTNQWDLLGTCDYHEKRFIDNVNSNEHSWRYKLSAVDSLCGNEAPMGRSYQTMNAVYLGPGVDGSWWVQWTPYKVAEVNNSVDHYELYSVDNLEDFNMTLVDEEVLYDGYFGTYYVNLPHGIQDSLFFVRAYVKQLYGGGTVMSNFVRNYEILSVGDDIATSASFKVWPNPNNGTFTVEGEGRLKVFNLLGQVVLDQTVTGKTSLTLPQGVYVVKLNDQITKLVVK